MKNLFKITLTFLLLALVLPTFSVSADPIGNPTAENNKISEIRGLWVSTVINIDYPKESTTDPEILKSEALKILDDAKNMGINTIFLQVRPTGDALYKSEIFPWSKYLTGTQGLPPYEDFDPLEFWVTEAHNRGMQLDAWINPYRITKKKSDEPKFDFASLDPQNPAIKHPDWVVKYNDGNLYFNPGIPEVRRLIIDGALEIIKNYKVDGIHMDDYFYPGKDFNDKDTYKAYGGDFSNIDDWRRNNVNSLVKEMNSAIKAVNSSMRFGISPFGIWANKKSNPLGSDTNGMESLNDHYADTLYWVKSGLLDYIAPQIYWNIGYKTADYSKLLNWWKNAVAGTKVDLYIGQAAYRSGDTNPASSWYGNYEILKQLQLNGNTKQVKGSIFFTYSSFLDNPSLSAAIKAFYELKDGKKAEIPVNIARPSENIRTSFDKFYLNGSSDPKKELYLNGVPVENRSNHGYFGLLVPLRTGPNIFTFSQEAAYSTRIIYREENTASSNKMSSAGIVNGSAFPDASEYRSVGEKIVLSCRAPIGSKVTVRINGKTYSMKPYATKLPGSGIYSTTFSYSYVIPDFKGAPRNISLGKPLYTMNYKGKIRSLYADSSITAIMKGSPYYAEVTKEVADTYPEPTSVNGAGMELYMGMTDYITGMTGSYVRLASGQWIKKTSIRSYNSKTQLKPVITNMEYSTGEKEDSLKLDINASCSATSDFDGKCLSLDLSPATAAVTPTLSENSIFSNITLEKGSNQLHYKFPLKDNERLDGYYIQKTSGGLVLHIKRHTRVKEEGSLSGKTIMVDPGHGGTETGTYGPLGLSYPEKAINLKTALKLKAELEKLGATVIMTRTEDRTLSLDARLDASRKARPDMFISIHANAMEDNVDMSKIDGVSVFYREAQAEQLSGTVFDGLKFDLQRNDQGMHERNFYVIRGTWTPSILVESGFVPNPNEFEWLIDESEQVRFAKSIADSVLKYFSN